MLLWICHWACFTSFVCHRVWTHTNTNTIILACRRPQSNIDQGTKSHGKHLKASTSLIRVQAIDRTNPFLPKAELWALFIIQALKSTVLKPCSVLIFTEKGYFTGKTQYKGHIVWMCVFAVWSCALLICLWLSSPFLSQILSSSPPRSHHLSQSLLWSCIIC